MNRPPSITPAKAFVASGHLLFIGLSVLAVQHWSLRTIHVDSACQIFKWIQYDGLQVEAHRYTAILPQLLVKLLALSGAPLVTLLLVASLAHVAVPWAIFSCIAHVLGRPWHAAGCALAAVLCTRLTFYGIVLEVNYLLCYPFLFTAALDAMAAMPHRRWPKLLAWPALALVLLVHPLGAFLALFVIMLHFLRHGWSVSGRWLAVAALFWALFSRSLLPPTGYEQGLYGGVGDGWASLRQGVRQPALEFFLGHTWGHTTHYLAWWVLFAVLAALLVRRRAWWTLFAVSGGAVAFMLLTMITYHQGETAVMMEKNFLPLAVLVSLPLLLELERMSGRPKWIALPLFVLVLFIQFRGISFASRPMGERFTLLQELVDRARASGPGTVLVEERELDARGLYIHWALPYEVLLLSGVPGPDACVLVRLLKDGEEGGDAVGPGTPDPRWFRPPAGPDHVL